MSEATFPFLQALGLDQHADERAVRRAYAQRLKRIDQANEPEAFQALRSDYETALGWLAWKARQADNNPAEIDGDATPEDAAASPEPSPGAEVAETGLAGVDAVSAAEPIQPPETDGEQLARIRAEEVFANFLQLSQSPFGDEVQARRALEVALSDDRLIHLESRTYFEYRVALLLMEGWRPGHEFLFGPACDLFHWDKDRRHLRMFGALGAAVDAAINEKLIFYRQSPQQFEAQRKLVRRLRDAREPSPQTLRASMPSLEWLVEHYPHWLNVVTSRENIVRWRQSHAALGPGDRGSNNDVPGQPLFRPQPAYLTSRNPVPLPLALILMGLLFVLIMANRPGSTGAGAVQQSISTSQSMPFPPLGDTHGRLRGQGSPLTSGDAQAALDIGATGSTRNADRERQLADLERRQTEIDRELKKARGDTPRSTAAARSPAPAASRATFKAPDPMDVPGLAAPSNRSPADDLLRDTAAKSAVPRLGGQPLP